MKKVKPKAISFKDLTKLVADECDYLQYEVDDVLRSMRVVIIKALSEGKSLKLEHLFTIQPKYNKARRYNNVIANAIVECEPTMSLSIKTTESLRRAMEPLLGSTEGVDLGEPVEASND